MAEIVVITGASSGIGRAAAHAFAAEGANLFLVARRRERLEEVSEECRELGSAKVVASSHDLSLPGEGARLVETALKQMGGLDTLICNAGFGCFSPASDYPPEKAARMWQVNFQSGYESIHAALPHFMEQRRGHIVMVSSILGKRGIAYCAPYAATKFAQLGLGQSLWGELRPFGIGVSVVCPGYTKTEFHRVAAVESGKGEVGRPLRGQDSAKVGQAILKAVRRNKREVHLTLPAKLLLLTDRLSPALANWVMLLAARNNKMD